MRDDRWSIRVARLNGVSVRIHLFFGLFAACTASFIWHAQSTQSNQTDLAAIGLISLGLLAVSMVWHEAAHLVIAHRYGGAMASLTIAPLIGLSRMTPPPDARDEMFAHLAGPLANLLLAACSGAALVATGLFEFSLLNPLAPAGVIEGPLWEVGLKLAFSINWILGLLNLLPAFPFDGGRALKAGILWQAPQLGSRVAARRVTMVARLTASLLVVGAVVCWPQEMHSALECFALTLLAIFVFFSPEQDPVLSTSDSAAFAPRHPAAVPTVRRLFTTDVESARRDDLRYEGFAREHDLVHAGEDAPLGRELVDGELVDGDRVERDLEDEDDELGSVDERRVDEILIRVHEHGMSGLSLAERAFLERASASYRHRRELGAR